MRTMHDPERWKRESRYRYQAPAEMLDVDTGVLVPSFDLNVRLFEPSLD